MNEGNAEGVISRSRWEYAFLTISQKAERDSSSNDWTWHYTAALSIRARTIAKWQMSYPANSLGNLNRQYSWSPVGQAPEEHRRVVYGPVDHLGDRGWDLVGVTQSETAVRTGAEIGWQTTMSIPLSTTYIFKRPYSNT